MPHDDNKKNKKPVLKSIRGVEVFSAGVWNGDKYTTDDLDAMVEAFQDLRQGFPPPVKLGHDDNQKILQNSGLPAAGWITNLRRRGKKLVADFEKIPSKIFDLLKNGAYRKVSSEIYWNLKVGEKVYNKVLGAVALLGGENPGVMNLDDILAVYGFSDYDSLKSYCDDKDALEIKVYSNTDFQEEKDMAGERTAREVELENKIEKLEAKLSEFKEKEQELKKYEAELSEEKKAKENLTKTQKELKDANEELRKEIFEARTEKNLADLEKEGLVTPAMKPFVKELLGEDKKAYSIKTEKGDEKKLSKPDLLKETLKLYKAASDVNLQDGSEGGRASKGQALIEEKIAKYQKEHDVDFGTAYAAVTNELEGDYLEEDED